MSATQDKNQKFTFVYSNLYQIHQKKKDPSGAESAKSDSAMPGSALPVAVPGPAHGQVLKTGDLHSSASPRIEPYIPTGLISRRVPPKAKTVVPSAKKSAPGSRNEAIESLKQNLNSLNELHSRLRFMLQELEELVRE